VTESGLTSDIRRADRHTFILVPGAGGAATWYWQLVLPLLREAGHEAIPVDLPGADQRAGLPEYAGLVTAAVGGRENVVLVAQSLGGFTAPLVAHMVPVAAIVMVNAMIPIAGETPGAWWDNTGWDRARVDAARRSGYVEAFDLDVYFLHDVPPEIAATGRDWPEADAVFRSTCDFETWPDVTTRVVAGRDDRFFPADFQQRVAGERLGLSPDVLPGGHLIALSRPEELARYLLALPL
jgi:predicted alpha/beta hydrolase family esterase